MSKSMYANICKYGNAQGLTLAMITGKSWIISLTTVSVAAVVPAFAGDSDMASGVVNSEHLFDKNARMQLIKSQQASRKMNVERAILLARKAVELDPDDLDARVALGDALYLKIKRLRDKGSVDSGLFNECVKTWLFVHRNVSGEEAGLSYKGIGMPFMSRFYEDEGRGALARKMLVELCGRVPKFYETNKRYLSKVLVPEPSVHAEIVGSTPAAKVR